MILYKYYIEKNNQKKLNYCKVYFTHNKYCIWLVSKVLRGVNNY